MVETMIPIVLIALNVLVLILLVTLLAKNGRKNDDSSSEALDNLAEKFEKMQTDIEKSDALTKANIETFGKSTLTGLQNVLSTTISPCSARR